MSSIWLPLYDTGAASVCGGGRGWVPLSPESEEPRRDTFCKSTTKPTKQYHPVQMCKAPHSGMAACGWQVWVGGTHTLCVSPLLPLRQEDGGGKASVEEGPEGQGWPADRETPLGHGFVPPAEWSCGVPGGMWQKGWVALSLPFSPSPWGGLGWQRPSLRLGNKSLAQWLEAADMIKPPNEGVGAEKGRM